MKSKTRNNIILCLSVFISLAIFLNIIVSSRNTKIIQLKGTWEEISESSDERILCDKYCVFEQTFKDYDDKRSSFTPLDNNQFKIDNIIYDYKIEGDLLSLTNDNEPKRYFKQVLKTVKEFDAADNFEIEDNNLDLYKKVNDDLLIYYNYQYRDNSGLDTWSSKFHDTFEICLNVQVVKGEIIQINDLIPSELYHSDNLDRKIHFSSSASSPNHNVTTYYNKKTYLVKRSLWTENEVMSCIKEIPIKIKYVVGENEYDVDLLLEDYKQ